MSWGTYVLDSNHFGIGLNIFNFHMNWYHGTPPILGQFFKGQVLDQKMKASESWRDQKTFDCGDVCHQSSATLSRWRQLMFVEYATTVETSWIFSIFTWVVITETKKLCLLVVFWKLLTVATCATNPRPLYRGGDNPLDPPQPHPT